MFKKFQAVLCLSIVATAQVFVEEADRISALEARVANLTQKETQHVQGGKNPTALDKNYRSGPYILSDLLYWQATMGGLEYVVRSHAPVDLNALFGAESATLDDGRLKGFEFDWAPGFRIGVGYHFKYDRWDSLLYWTRYHNHCSSSARPHGNGSLSGAWVPLVFGGGETQHATAHWHFRYDVVDLELGRSFYLTKALSGRPFIGLRGAIIGQHCRFRYDDLNNPNVHDLIVRTKNDYDAGGLRTGAQMNFRFNQHFSFWGSFAAALLYGHFDVKLGLQLPGVDLGGLKLGYTGNYNRVKTNVEAGLGIQWETGYSEGRYHLTILACYEFSQWFNQNQLIKIIIPGMFIPSVPSGDGDLGLQGATLSARFDF